MIADHLKMHLIKQLYSRGRMSSEINWKAREVAMLLDYREGMIRGLESANIGTELHNHHTQRSNHRYEVKSVFE